MKALLQLGVWAKFTSSPLNKSKITDIHDHPYYNGLEEPTSIIPESCTTVNILLTFLSPCVWLNEQSSKSYLYYTEERRKKSAFSYNLFLNRRQ